jgi:hypothetical protein
MATVALLPSCSGSQRGPKRSNRRRREAGAAPPPVTMSQPGTFLRLKTVKRAGREKEGEPWHTFRCRTTRTA